MKCPNCGAEMKEGLLYCESCGEDIHIVPDFEPELEQNMEQSLQQILKDVAPIQERAETTGKGTQEISRISGKGKARVKTMLGWTALAAFAAAVIWGGVKIFQYYSPEYQTERAAQEADAGQYDKAIRFYERARELDEFNVELKFELAEVYFLKNDKENYEYWLREIVTDPRTEPEQLESAYGKLIAIYRAREDYQTINDMLLACTSDSIREAYQSYIAETPQFSVDSGEYDEVKALKITVTERGDIYYTMDGTTPDETKLRYTAPILLEGGDYQVKAVYVNENGISSPVAEAEYRISVSELEAPELSVDSGEYDTPMFITVTNDPENVFYTVDGTVPTMESRQYTEPIPMPIGENHFCFMRLESGRSSSLVDLAFTLELHAELMPEAAVDKLRDNMLEAGKIYDKAGHFDDSGAYYLYEYLYVADVGQNNISYVVAEVLVNAEGSPSRTGNYFAVNVYSGELFRLQADSGEYQRMETE